MKMWVMGAAGGKNALTNPCRTAASTNRLQEVEYTNLYQLFLTVRHGSFRSVPPSSITLQL
jgi:hypothetical protein